MRRLVGLRLLWMCAFMDLRISTFPQCGLEKFRTPTENACVQLLQLDKSAFRFILFPVFFSSSSTQFQYYPIVSTKLHFRTGRDVPREGTALFDVPLHVCPGCCASGSLRAAAFGCDGADLGPKVPGYQRHRKRWVFEILWIKEPARHVPVAEKVAEKVFL